MDVREAVLSVLRDAGEPLHWTVIQDRALRAGSIDPFTTKDVRGAVLTALRELTAEGVLAKPAKGSYEIATGGTRSG
jgi:hypothetical protein